MNTVIPVTNSFSKWAILTALGLIMVMNPSVNLYAQENDPGRQITINMSASHNIPADLILFNISINAEGKDPASAFEIHKKREQLLAGLLKKFELPEEDIRFDPVRFSKRYRDDQLTTQTQQSVTVTFSDFAMYEKIQIALIENGFDTFNGKFSSTQLGSGKEKAIKKAIEAATERATLITETSGVRLGNIQNIQYSEHRVSVPPLNGRMELSVMDSGNSMMDFDQSVTVTANISISYTLWIK